MTQATDMLAAYIAAETAVLAGQEYTIGGRRLRLSDLTEIRKGRAEWQRAVNAEAANSVGSPTLGGMTFKLANLSGSGT